MDPLQIVIEGIDNASGVIDGVGGALSGLADVASGALTMGLAAAAAGATALVAGLGVALSAAMDNEKLQAQLAATIKATGGAAGLTAEDANALAQQFRSLAGGSDDAIIAIETIGLRAGTISAEEMPAFIQSTLDLGAVMGSTTAAAELLARAQDDPVAAFKKLEKATGAYDSALEENIKKMVDAGDTAGALDLINQKLAETTGGAAAANAETLSGQIEIFKGTLGEAAETIGTALLPIAKELFEEVIAPAIPIVETLAGAVASFFTDLQEGTPKEALDALGQTLATVFGPEIAEQITGFVDGLMTGVGNLVAFFQSNMPLIQDTVGVVFGAVMEVAGALGAFFTDTLLPAITTIFTEITGEAPNAQTIFTGVMEAIQNGATLAAGFIKDVLVPALTAAVDWVVANWPAFQDAIETAVNYITEVVLPGLMGFLNDVLIPTIQGVLTAIQEFWATWGDDIMGVVTGVTDFIGLLFATWSAAFSGDWATFGFNLGTIWRGAWDAIALILSDAATALGGAVSSLIGTIITLWNETDWGALGSNIISSIVSMLYDGDSAIRHAMRDIVDAAIAAVWNAIVGWEQGGTGGGGTGGQSPGGQHGPQSVAGGHGAFAPGGTVIPGSSGGGLDGGTVQAMNRFADAVDRLLAGGGQRLDEVRAWA